LAQQSALNFNRIGLLYHGQLPQSRVLAAEMLEFIEDMGATAWVSRNWGHNGFADRLTQTDLLITLGGDGSVLRAARLALGHNIVLLGVNQGQIGFLAELQPAEWRPRFEQMLTGPCWVEERLMIRAEWQRDNESKGVYDALNEVVISRGGPAKVIRLETFINNSYLTTYTADGMILSTPTGSTAYALAAGGPILPPELKNVLLIPVAPHLSLDRGVILSEGEHVKLIVHTRSSDSTAPMAVLTVDGQIDVEVANQDVIEISTSPYVSRFLRLQERTYFYKTLMQRLGWPQIK
jgi:NAD+ kinase